jgi:hypothetical protein
VKVTAETARRFLVAHHMLAPARSLERWNGARWSISGNPQPLDAVKYDSSIRVDRVAALAVGAGGRLRAVGRRVFFAAGNPCPGCSKIEHDSPAIQVLRGRRLHEMPLGAGCPRQGYLTAISSSRRGRGVWAVGRGDGHAPIVEWNGKQWQCPATG